MSDRRILTKEDLDSLRIRAAKPFADQGDGLDSSDCDLLFDYIEYLEENALMTPEEADRAYDEAEPISLKPGQAEQIAAAVTKPAPSPTPGEVEEALSHVEGRLQYDASGRGDWACTECNEQEPRHKASCELATLRAALSRGGGWTPIETAPKDGRCVALLMQAGFAKSPGTRDVGYWTDHNGGGWVTARPGTPVAWAEIPPLPPPPPAAAPGEVEDAATRWGREFYEQEGALSRGGGRWTREVPTKPGWYWCFPAVPAKGSLVHCAQVWEAQGILMWGMYPLAGSRPMWWQHVGDVPPPPAAEPGEGG